VQKAQAALMDATLAAMKQQDPQTEELMQQLQQKQEQMKQMMESAGHGH
jgi:alpha-D-ribose 1-methylphosphonate 5-triphosphate synthase subunit PhnG